MSFDFARLSPEDRDIFERYVGDPSTPPDLIITTDDNVPYLYRWFVIPRIEGDTTGGQIYFHIQTSGDPERPLHDHPWHNMSVILSGGYDEIIQPEPPSGECKIIERRKGQTVFRMAQLPHRLILPEGIPYTMTQFTTGPKLRTWGFWIGPRWFPYWQCVRDAGGGKSVFVYPHGSLDKLTTNERRALFPAELEANIP